MIYLFYVCLIKDYLNYNIEISFPFQILKGHTQRNIQNKKWWAREWPISNKNFLMLSHQTTNLYFRAIVSIVTLKMFVLLWIVVLWRSIIISKSTCSTKTWDQSNIIYFSVSNIETQFLSSLCEVATTSSIFDWSAFEIVHYYIVFCTKTTQHDTCSSNAFPLTSFTLKV